MSLGQSAVQKKKAMVQPLCGQGDLWQGTPVSCQIMHVANIFKSKATFKSLDRMRSTGGVDTKVG